ncbi:3-deoxy-D-manno-octulosonic acid transferase, partial [Desulfovibrio sp. OttesenSCG-928-I05]|nr:3-deoxy-D-manno-octulosonic acid transferase [Desulfovibrio sp. OttesenSCG-928-I05]
MPTPLFNVLYAALWKGARPFLRRHKRLRDSFERRLVPPGWGGSAPGGADDVPPCDCWIQAASGGEAFLASRLVHALAERVRQTESANPSARPLRVLCTSCTRQGMDVLERLAADAADAAGSLSGITVVTDFFPLDEPALMRRALDVVRPRAVALLETELWPGLMAASAAKGIPMLVLNGRMRGKSLSGYRRLGFFWKQHAPDAVLAISTDDAARFAALFGSERVSVMPNMKFEELPGTSARTSAEAGTSPLSELFGSAPPPLLLASVRQEEEALLLPQLETLLRSATKIAPGTSLIIAPRHMERVPFWREALSAFPFPVSFRSELDGAFPAGHLVIWDRFGELGALYAEAGAVFVGGSLAPLGGQNFLEPAAAGVIPCVGPSWSNFAWASELFEHGLVHQVADAAELARILPAQLTTLDRPRTRQAYEAFIARK